MTRETKRPATDPASQDFITSKRQKDAETKQKDVAERERLLVRAASVGDHPNVLVVKRSEQAAKAEQERLDIGAAAGAAQKPAPPPEPAPTSGTLPPTYVPAHPLIPGPRGSAPFDPTTPAGPMDEDVIHVTADIAPDGTPLVQAGSTMPEVPEYDGLHDRTIKLRNIVLPKEEPPEPLINQHSPEGAALDAKKTGQEVVYVPNEATLDPVSNDPYRT